ncbi:unnamed protein product [Nippostrongylus brasiliensis]|uniref:DUF21 domain-containing protein n=1 Tax=Nippostrongylus brasiliensis TaxID=27835 RepID=A0A0N4YT11_NIPBR|nr:unnamed protein product [Nippostrongylus brasiliensis]
MGAAVDEVEEAIILVLIVAGILTENPTIALVVFLLVALGNITYNEKITLKKPPAVWPAAEKKVWGEEPPRSLLRIVVMGIRVGLDVYSMVTKPDRRKVCVFILLGLWRLRMAWVDKAAEEQKSSQQAPA